MIDNPKLRAKAALLPRILASHQRIAVTGGPKTGKSGITGEITDRPVFHSDDDKLAWEHAPLHLMNRTQGHRSYAVAGIHAVRAVRKGLPVEAIIHMGEPLDELSEGQQRMIKAQKTILEDVKRQYPWIVVYEL